MLKMQTQNNRDENYIVPCDNLRFARLCTAFSAIKSKDLQYTIYNLEIHRYREVSHPKINIKTKRSAGIQYSIC